MKGVADDISSCFVPANFLDRLGAIKLRKGSEGLRTASSVTTYSVVHITDGGLKRKSVK